MKFDIENKILIPFMILIVFSISVLGGFSYYNGYRTLEENLKSNQREFVTSVVYDFSSIISSDSIAKENRIEYYNNYFKPGLLIFESNDIYVDQLPSIIDSKLIIEIIGSLELPESNNNKKTKSLFNIVGDNDSPRNYEYDNYIFTFKLIAHSNMMVVMVGDKDLLINELMNSQKYAILIAIISLIISMQAAIFIAHHLSKPIRILADQCNQLSDGNLDIRLVINRSDEIGVLAESFNHMFENLQKNAKKLIEANRFNENILRSLSTGVLVSDEKGDILNLNDAAKRLMNPTLSDVYTNQLLSELLKIQLLEALLKQESVKQLYDLRANGIDERYHYDITASLLTNEDSKVTGAILSVNDMSELKRLELNVERMNRLASIGQLASGLAHEIRNPLAGMKMSVQVLERRLINSPEDKNFILFEGITHDIERLNHLVTELLDFAKPRHPEKTIVNFTFMIQKFSKWLKPTLDDKKIDLVLDLPDESVFAQVDEKQVEQILINILNNAMNASKQGDKISLTLRSNLTNLFFPIEIIVEDQGCGISQDKIQKVFDPFYTTHAVGTGLGLSIVHKLMVDNGGEIDLSSRLNIGTSVILKFKGPENISNKEKSNGI